MHYLRNDTLGDSLSESVELRDVTTTLDTETDVHVGEPLGANDEDGLVDLVSENDTICSWLVSHYSISPVSPALLPCSSLSFSHGSFPNISSIFELDSRFDEGDGGPVKSDEASARSDVSHSRGSLETLSIQFLLDIHASSLTFFLPNVCTEDMFYLSVLLNGRIPRFES